MWQTLPVPLSFFISTIRALKTVSCHLFLDTAKKHSIKVISQIFLHFTIYIIVNICKYCKYIYIIQLISSKCCILSSYTIKNSLFWIFLTQERKILGGTWKKKKIMSEVTRHRKTNRVYSLISRYYI